MLLYCGELPKFIHHFRLSSEMFLSHEVIAWNTHLLNGTSQFFILITQSGVHQSKLPVSVSSTQSGHQNDIWYVRIVKGSTLQICILIQKKKKEMSRQLSNYFQLHSCLIELIKAIKSGWNKFDETVNFNLKIKILF